MVAIVLAFIAGATTAPLPRTDVFASPTKEAEFRWLAKDMLKSLQMPSCTETGLQAPQGFSRADLLKPEQKALRDFEESVKGTSAKFHLETAKADAELETAENESCWAEYNDLEVANRHLKMTQDDVRVGLSRMQELAAALSDPRPTNPSPADGAKFRVLVRDLTRTIRPRCRQTSRAENRAVLAPAIAEVSLFRDGLTGSDYAVHFDIAEADVAYFDSISQVECDNPSRDSVRKLSQQFLDSVKRQIAAIERKFPRR